MKGLGSMQSVEKVQWEAVELVDYVCSGWVVGGQRLG